MRISHRSRHCEYTITYVKSVGENEKRVPSSSQFPASRAFIRKEENGGFIKDAPLMNGMSATIPC